MFKTVSETSFELTYAVYGEADSLDFRQVWFNLNATAPWLIPALLDQLSQSAAVTGKPLGIPDDVLNADLADFLPDDVDDPLLGYHAPDFVEFMLRNSTLPDHAWVDNPEARAAFEQLAAVFGMLLRGDMSALTSPVTPAPLPPAALLLVQRVQEVYLNFSRETGSPYYMLAEELDFNMDGVVSVEEYTMYWVRSAVGASCCLLWFGALQSGLWNSLTQSVAFLPLYFVRA